MDRGYIKLWRKVNDCKALKERGKVFSKLEAWIHIVMVLAHGIETDNFGRGEFEASYRYLGKAWRWDVSKTYRFILDLISENMLEKVKHQMKQEAQRFKVTNYDTYNPLRNTDNNTKRNKVKEGINESIKEVKDYSPRNGISPSVLFEIYESENKQLPQVKARSQDRLAKCRSRINQAERSGCLEQYLQDFRAAVAKAQSTPFLCGEKGWRADFDWFIANQTNPYKVLEGKYDSFGDQNGKSKLPTGEAGATSEQRNSRGDRLYIPKQ